MPDPVKALVITGFGLNCERETTTALETSGVDVAMIHLNDLLRDAGQLMQYHIVAFIGGFSFGDHLGAGTVLANRVKAHMGSELNEFITSGRLVVGICNGFQTLTRLGLVPALGSCYFKQTVAMAPNDSGLFRNCWVTLKCNPASPCIFTRGIDMLPLPIRHGEGKFVSIDDKTLADLEEQNLVAVRYVDPATGDPATTFPHNPNGSVNAIAGICDPSGRIFGLMPHPEAYLSPYNHPHWTRQKINGVLPETGLGQQIFDNAVRFARDEFFDATD